MENILENILNKNDLDKEDIKFLLNLTNENDVNQLFDKAYSIKAENVKKIVYFRGIIEFSNVCQKDCLYCGIRKSNINVERYMMERDEIIRSALWAYENDYGSVVLQSGERDDSEFVDFIESILKEIKAKTEGKLGITISLGEQTYETYKRWFDAGAHRYLLRIETSDKNLYSTLHPDDHLFEYRYQCLEYLRKIGYQVGTGVMIGLPGQTIDKLADDILFFKEFDVDMIGMGPYIPHNQTPLAKKVRNFDKKAQFKLALKVIAITRILMNDINIAATTALQSLEPTGREIAIKAGANIIMPNVTATKYREGYQLYEDKPCMDENSEQCKGCLSMRIGSIDEEIGLKEWGDSPHFFKRKSN